MSNMYTYTKEWKPVGTSIVVEVTVTEFFSECPGRKSESWVCPDCGEVCVIDTYFEKYDPETNHTSVSSKLWRCSCFIN